jgi:asparagine synthase (glutamine-hydrolysing)
MVLALKMHVIWMSIYAFADMADGRVDRIYASARFPSKQEGNLFFDSEESVDLKYADEMPLRVEGFYAMLAFKARYILISRDVIGGKPLYYNPLNLTFSSFKSYVEHSIELIPGEVIKLGYNGSVLSRKVYRFEDVFPRKRASVEQLVEEIEKSLTSFNHRSACLAFSGGVDSSLLASLYDVQLISVTASREEKEWVEKAAKKLGRDLEVFVFGERDVENAIPHIISSIETSDAMQVSIAIPVYLSLKFAKELGYSSVIFGQGADELFGGYKRYEILNGMRLGDELESDVKNLGRNNLVRDTKLAYSVETRILTPYLQWDVIKAAINIPSELKIRKIDGAMVRKFILREIASNHIPKELAYRDKKAIQYSTKALSILMKIAKRDGMRLKEYLRIYES